jgi:hypothetical protein
VKYLSIATLYITLISACTTFAMEENTFEMKKSHHRNSRDTQINITRQRITSLVDDCREERDNLFAVIVLRTLSVNTVHNAHYKDPLLHMGAQKQFQYEVAQSALNDYNDEIINQNLPYEDTLDRAHESITDLAITAGRTHSPIFARTLKHAFSKPLDTN